MRLHPRNAHLSRSGLRAATVVAALALPLSLAAPAGADPGAADQRRVKASITAPGAKRHLRKLQEIARANGGTRASGTPGYAASRDYVAGQLRKAGYKVTVQPFEFPFFQENSTALLNQVSPDPTTYQPTPPDGGTVGDFATMTYSGSGDVTATVQAVDLTLPPSSEPGSTSGCEASDFASFTAGNIALLQRGTCTFEEKARNAQAAGAAAVIIFNEGQPGRTETLQGTLGQPGFTIPVVGTSFAVGEDLASPEGTVVRVKTDTESENRTTWNVLAESKKGRADRVVMSGAHLDSVPAGPGINDNGSGSAALLEVALRTAKLRPKNKVRFAWWGAEELGLLGAEHYVADLSDAERAKIRLYLNYDMVASPNYAFKIYDGDDSDATGAPAGPPGSDEIEKTFEKYFDALRIGHVGTDFDGRSDYGPFIEAGIPSGGLFTGAEGIKTAEEAELFGGTAGEAYDKCYHQACDDLSNISDRALAVNLGAIAHSTLTYAYSNDLPGPENRTAAAGGARTAAADHGHDHGLTR
ncbi:M28 family metallopeptidase [Actinomadura sp. NBRC 104425]|uniref:M28 family metallopeptidase n=1 Tax=Actinomadura sp. NBRC 104425 TaxID=3032204 RepID=UPI002553BCB4|nr:M28 family metallopeptidase [Actinomadura sp. NBRC 104425]